MSFKDKTFFTMEAGKEKSSRSTLADFKRFRIKLLPIAAIFGSNGSGKSNFIKAISFVQRLLTEPEKGVFSSKPYAFCFDEKLRNEPSEIEIQLMLGKYVYSYFLSFTNQRIVNESLILINTSSSNLLFSRSGTKLETGPALSKTKYEFSFFFRHKTFIKITKVVNLCCPSITVLHTENWSSSVRSRPVFKINEPKKWGFRLLTINSISSRKRPQRSSSHT